MKVLRNFFVDHLAIDLGSVNTLVYVPGRGIILNEPSVVALDKYSREVLTVGAPALKLLGREPRETEIHRPIRGGAIDNFEVAQKMLKAFLGRVRDGHRRSHLVIGVPGSSTTIEQRSIREAVRDVRAGRVDLIDEGLAAALGAGLALEDEHARLVVDIGGGTTNIAIVASGGVISSLSLSVAGNAMDEAIREYMRVSHSIQIGECTAERVKRELGATGAKASTEVSRMEVVGKDVANGGARALEIEASEVRTALEPVLTEIIRGIQRVIEEAHPEVTTDLYYYGVILTGGGALLTGMADRLCDELRLHVVLAEEPLLSVTLGAGRLLEEPEKLERAAIRQDIRVWEASPELVVNW
ncbi:MAG TPA: rod shape-determining protein [Pyrinomonadaceae bacterium]|nr:rod shape-determining protein [Pyrinomonadaceae bacterium]